MSAPSSTTVDRRGRPLHDLRISVTDRCNLRCTYCMPRAVFGPDFPFLARAELLTFEEIERVVRAACTLGVRKVRLTGGEPLMRSGLADLVAMLAAVPGIEVVLTTNGTLLARHAEALRRAGLARVTVSLDSLDDDVFEAMADGGIPVGRVLDGIDAAHRAGLGPVKVNAVVRRGVNEGSVLPLARHFRGTGHVLRFIEYMDVGGTNGWCADEVVPAAEIVALLDAELGIERLPPAHPGEVATRYRYRDGGGEVGVVSSVTAPFCGTCSRARLSAEGRLYTCLFATHGHNLRRLLRGGASDRDVQAAMAEVWSVRDDRYSELRGRRAVVGRKVEMSHIGG